MQLMQHLKHDLENHQASGNLSGFAALAVYRFGRWSATQPGPLRFVTSKLYGAAARAAQAVTRVHIERECEIGEDLHLIHQGVVHIHPSAKIGNRVGMMHGVTLGTEPGSTEAPTIGDDVFIGANATLIGAITVGDGATVAANSLVISDVPAGATAIGVPARIIKLKTMRKSGSDTPVAPAAHPPSTSSASG
jgi:serine O-acetyltransferase